MWQSRNAHTIVVVTAGLDLYVAGVVARLFRPQARVVAVDFLMPGSTRASSFQSWALRRVDAWACVRSHDIHTLLGASASTRLAAASSRPTRVRSHRCTVGPSTGRSHRYVYASGMAHRDWATLFRASSQSTAMRS